MFLIQRNFLILREEMKCFKEAASRAAYLEKTGQVIQVLLFIMSKSFLVVAILIYFCFFCVILP